MTFSCCYTHALTVHLCSLSMYDLNGFIKCKSSHHYSFKSRENLIKKQIIIKRRGGQFMFSMTGTEWKKLLFDIEKFSFKNRDRIYLHFSFSFIDIIAISCSHNFHPLNITCPLTKTNTWEFHFWFRLG